MANKLDFRIRNIYSLFFFNVNGNYDCKKHRSLTNNLLDKLIGCDI
ncbi:MAG TPA: hypothetical protein VFD25_03350 [Clostridia bacterium]|nr:hypothetical protein [Clostridia bacterium]